jgi:hypothetical protein
VSKAANREEERHGVVYEPRIGVLTCDRKSGVFRTPSPREHTRAWRAGTHLRQTMIEESCVIDISGGINVKLQLAWMAKTDSQAGARPVATGMRRTKTLWLGVAALVVGQGASIRRPERKKRIRARKIGSIQLVERSHPKRILAVRVGRYHGCRRLFGVQPSQMLIGDPPPVSIRHSLPCTSAH